MIGERSLEVTLVKTGKRLQWVDSTHTPVTAEGRLGAGSCLMQRNKHWAASF